MLTQGGTEPRQPGNPQDRTWLRPDRSRPDDTDLFVRAETGGHYAVARLDKNFSTKGEHSPESRLAPGQQGTPPFRGSTLFQHLVHETFCFRPVVLLVARMEIPCFSQEIGMTLNHLVAFLVTDFHHRLLFGS